MIYSGQVGVLLMAKIFVFVNQKGGVGKTTSAINIGAYFAIEGKKTLLVDFDPQGNLSSGVGLIKPKKTAYDLISGNCNIEEVIFKTPVLNLELIPANIDLSGAAVELVDEKRREFFLHDALQAIADDYDYILIDCPPSLGILTLNGLVCATHVLVPLQCEYFALEGLSLLLETIARIQSGLNKDLELGGIFFTMYDSRTRLAQEVVQQVLNYFKEKVFKTLIPRNVRLSEAPSHGLPISEYDPSSTGAKSYQNLALEILQSV